ncbi:MAG: dihydrolipoamide acetyltransferase family protein [Pseudomonadota bacterium]|nr:dihydrolipoamide acetyltransferase family protein [Pseudomonadota bacterium]
MATKDIVLPDIGEGVTEGEVVKWLVKPGDMVKEDQPVVEIMTDKATVEVPSPFTGSVKEFRCKEGDIVPIGKPLMVIELGSDSKTAAPLTAAPRAPAPAPSPTQVMVAPNIMAAASSGGLEVYPPVAESSVLATPATRRLAREMKIDVNKLTGTGNGGRVTREDVLKSLNATFSAPAAVSKGITAPAYVTSGKGAEERVPFRGIRRKIAESLQMAKHIIPHFTLMDEANVTQLVEMRTQLKPLADKQGIKITYLPFVIKALIATIREYPMFSASIDDQSSEIVYKKYFNIGFAADTPNGLLVPVIKDADKKTIYQISREIVELATKARDGKLALEDMRGATITITNIGSVGGTYATPIINHPEVAILGMYKITDKPVIIGSDWHPAKFMNFTITADHRLIDGAVAANFLKAFLNRIENPSLLMLDMM